MQLPFKITHGAVFRTAVVDTINNLIDYLHASRVKGDSRTIKVQETAGGVIISAIPQSIPSTRTSSAPAAAGYSGYFAVVDVPTIDGSPATQIKIVDGADPSGTLCGSADIKDNIPVATIAKVDQSVVWCVAAYSAGAISISFQCASSHPTGNVGYIPIASIDANGKIRQLWLNNRLVFRGEFLI